MSNRGLKQYTKQLKQEVGNAVVSVNINKEDANLHITLPLLSSIGLSPIETGLVFNYQQRNTASIFGNGFQLNYFGKITDNTPDKTMTNADGSIDIYKLSEDYYNKETQMTLKQVITDAYELDYHYEVKDKYENKKIYESYNMEYPTRIEMKSGDNYTLDFISNPKTISNGKGDVIEFSYENSSNIRKISYKHLNNEVCRVELAYSGTHLQTLRYMVGSEVFGQMSLTYSDTLVEIIDDISGNCMKYFIEDGRVKEFIDGNDGDYTKGITTLIRYEDAKTIVTIDNKEELYVFFDKTGFPLFEMDSKGNVIETEYDKDTKQIKTQSSVIQTKHKLPNLLPSNSVAQFTASGVNVEKVTCSDPFFSTILGDSVYKVSGTGTLSFTLSMKGIATDHITAILFGKQLTNYSSNSNVSVQLRTSDTDSDTFKKETIDGVFDLMTLGVSALESYNFIELRITLTGNASIEMGGIQVLRKKFGSFYNYDEVGNKTLAGSGMATANVSYNSSNLPSTSIGTDSTMYEYDYDSRGNLQSVKSAYGVKIENTFNSNNQVQKNKVSNIDGTKILETRKEYTSDGRFLSVEYDELNHETFYKNYDSLGRVKEICNALKVTTKLDYFADGNLKQILLEKDNKSMQADYVYDDKKRVRFITLKNGSKYEFVYDEFSNLTEIKLNDSTMFSYTYDIKTGNILKQKYGTSSDAYRFEYNSDHLISKVYYVSASNEETLKYQYFYNDLLQLVSVTDGQNNLLNAFTYDSDGNILSTSTSNATISYHYDNLGAVNRQKKEVVGKKIYQSYDTVSRSKGSNPEAIMSSFTDKDYLTCFFINDGIIRNARYGIKPYKYTGEELTIQTTRQGVFPCINMLNNSPISYPLSMSNPHGDYACGSVAFWMKPSNTYSSSCLFSVQSPSGSGIEVSFSNGRMVLSVRDIYGLTHTLLTTSSIISGAWNFFALNFLNRNDAQNTNVCEYALTLNDKTQIYKKQNPRLYVEIGATPVYHIGHLCNGATSTNRMSGYITGLMIGARNYLTLNEMQNYYRTTKDYMIDNEYVDAGVKTVDFSQTSLFTIDPTIQNQFNIFPLQNDVVSLNGTKPTAFDIRNVSKIDKDRTFNFNKKSKRYAYVADGANLQYDLGMQGSGTIMMRTYIDGSAERQYFFENKDSSGHTLGLYRNTNNILCIDYNGSIYQTTLSFSSNVWHTVGLSYHEGITSDSLSTTTYLDVRVYLNGQTYSLELDRGFNFGICSTMIGRKKYGIHSIYNLGTLYNVYPLHGQIEMLATRSAFCELSTLNTLAEELKGITKVNQYDELGMLKKIDLHQAGTSILSNTISYKTKDDDSRYLSKQVCQEVFKSPKFTIYREYTTDDLGNITVINDGIFGSHEYAYDYRGFLTEDGSDGYSYDDNGNIRWVNDIELKYDSPIKDRLTSVDGKEVTYDEHNLGNPKTWNGNEYTYEGRRLIKYKKGNEEYEYQYNEQGLRICKTKGNETTNYYYDGDKLITEITPSYRNDFLYDENGLLYGFIHNNEDKYFYVRDTMQNILGIVSQSGELVVKYDYNAYGLPKLTTDTSGKGIGSINPFRYKGYYYDSESNMYYCKSRYYVPDWCRWLNADNPNFLDTESLTGMNLFAYCGNNPVLNIDDSGNSWWSKILIGVGIIATATVIGALIITSGGTAAPLIPAIITGVKTGLTIATVSAVTSGTIRAGRSIAKNVSEGNDFSTTIKNVGKSFLSGFGDGFAAGATYYGTTSLLSMYGCQEFGYFNNGQGYEAPTYTIGYQNPSVAGVTLYASKIGGKFRIDMDPLHSLHYHYGKTNKQRKAHKGSWIGGIVTGIIVGFSGEVY